MFLQAAIKYFEAQADEARAVLHLYLTEPVAIADHGDILKVIVEQTKRLSEAEECLSTLKKYHR